jgi:hypothetical protein
MATKRTNPYGSLAEIVWKTEAQSKLLLFIDDQADEWAAHSAVQLIQILFSVICLCCEGKTRVIKEETRHQHPTSSHQLPTQASHSILKPQTSIQPQLSV